MAIASLDGVIAGTQPPVDCFKVGITMKAAGVAYSPFYQAGFPGAASAPTPGLAGAALTTYTGQIPFTNPSAGNSYLSRMVAWSTGAGTLYIYDRLWHNSGFTITTTTAETVNSVAWPARDRTGTTNGDNVMVGIEVSSATGNGSPITNTTMSYTNQAGTASKTATIASFPATATQGTFVPFALAAGDTGVRSIQSMTKGTSYVSGTIHLVAYRLLAVLSLPTANQGFELNAITGGFPRMFDNTVPFPVFIPTATTAVNLALSMNVAQG